jgi:protein-S-isoprenylcysteine O-methyltransferase Ste14
MSAPPTQSLPMVSDVTGTGSHRGRRFVSLVMPAACVLVPLVGARSDRLLHPGPWVALATLLIIFWNQPPLPRWQCLTARGDDRRTGSLILVVVGFCTVLPIAEFAHRVAAFPAPISAWVMVGTLGLGLGTALRVWAVRTLGRYFTALVTVQARQAVIEEGPYALVRHPAYSGSLLACIGGAVLFESLVTLVVILVVALPAYLFRIRVEEKVLCEHLGPAYLPYRARTWKLIPYVY